MLRIGVSMKLSLPIFMLIQVALSALCIVNAAPPSNQKNHIAINSSKEKKVDNDVTLISRQVSIYNLQKERFIGNQLKGALEVYHFTKKKINDDLSKKAFKEFIKKLDYGKQFLLEKDVTDMSVFNRKMDDQMISGEHQLVNLSMTIMEQRVSQIAKYREEFFKKQFTFKVKESIEFDQKKRKHFKNNKEQKEYWRKVFKQSVLSKYISLIDEQEEEFNPKKKKDKKKSKKKNKKKIKIKKLSDKELRKKAFDKTNKKYTKFFKRIQKDERMDFIDKFFNSISMIFDPHTNYLAPKKKEDFDIDISGSLEGIGAVLQEDGSFIKVVKIVPGGAAWRQKGLQVDDIILSVSQGKGKEAVDLVDMKVDNAVRYIRGKKGTEVRLGVKHSDGTRVTIPIIRDVVQIGASFAKSSVLQIKGSKKKFGYIHLPKFYRDFDDENGRTCTGDVLKEINALKKKNIAGLILDLRNNGGGALEDAKLMSGLFIKEGPIVQIKNHDKSVNILKDIDTNIQFKAPLIVMINRFSASASEILAAALQDYGRAVIVGGEFSHGKGTVQAVLNINRGQILSFKKAEPLGALKVTIQKFYRISGDSTQYRGVTPDIIIPDPFSYTENREQDLEFSLPWDQVPPLEYSPWKNAKYKMSNLLKRSQSRVKKSKRFKKINAYVSYLKSRKDDTKASLNLKEVLARNKKNEEMSKKLKLDDENKNIIITDFERSLKSNENIKKGEEKQWKEDFKQRKEEWIKALRMDAGLEEAMHILTDMVAAK